MFDNFNVISLLDYLGMMAPVILFIISWKLTLITLAGVIPIVFFAMFFGFKVRDLSKNVQDVKAEIG